MKLFYLGPEGTNTQIAAELLSAGEILTPSNSFKKIINEVDKNPNYKGVIALENSLEGIVRESIDNLIRTKDPTLRIVKEVILPISHCLITKANDIKDIKVLYSHPQALGQCQNYINTNLDQNIKIMATPSTSEAVKMLKDKDKTHAAIANQKAASLYNINILKQGINDEPDNKTRFVLLGREQLEKTGNDKTSFAFSTQNKAGALVDVMSVFKKYDINLSYIDSRPSKKLFGTYTFFIECDAYIEDDNLIDAIQEIEHLTTFIKFIGSYPKG